MSKRRTRKNKQGSIQKDIEGCAIGVSEEESKECKERRVEENKKKKGKKEREEKKKVGEHLRVPSPGVIQIPT